MSLSAVHYGAGVAVETPGSVGMDRGVSVGVMVGVGVGLNGIQPLL